MKTEHNGAKHGCGAWYGRKKEAKEKSRHTRRTADKKQIKEAAEHVREPDAKKAA